MPFAVKFVLPRKHIYRNGVSFALLPTRISCIRRKVSVNLYATLLNTLSRAKAGNTSAYGNAAGIQTDCISTGYSIFRREAWSERSSKQRITVPKTTECRRRTRTLTFLNGTGVTIFRRSARRWKCSIRSDI